MLNDLESAINVKDAKESKETYYITSSKNKMSDQARKFYKVLEDVEQELCH